MRRFFCNCCGKELGDDNKHRVVLRDRMEKKDKTALYLCEKDVRLVEKMKFIPYTNVRERRIPKFFNVKVAYPGGKEKTLYVVPEWNIPQINALDKTDKTKLFTRDGHIYYTPEYVLMTIDREDIGTKKLLEWIRLLFTKQTDDEKKEYKTKWHNNQGFNKPDAQFMSAMARVSFDKSDEALSEKQLEVVRKRFRKYAAQVADLLNDQYDS